MKLDGRQIKEVLRLLQNCLHEELISGKEKSHVGYPGVGSLAGETLKYGIEKDGNRRASRMHVTLSPDSGKRRLR